MKIPKPILERRRSIRIDESLPFKIGHEGYEIQVRTLNISSHGALCAVERDMPLMTQLKVALSLNGHALRLKGVVVRKEKDPASHKFHIAVFFPDISPKDRTLIKEYIEARLKP